MDMQVEAQRATQKNTTGQRESQDGGFQKAGGELSAETPASTPWWAWGGGVSHQQVPQFPGSPGLASVPVARGERGRGFILHLGRKEGHPCGFPTWMLYLSYQPSPRASACCQGGQDLPRRQGSALQPPGPPQPTLPAPQPPQLAALQRSGPWRHSAQRQDRIPSTPERPDTLGGWAPPHP